MRYYFCVDISGNCRLYAPVKDNGDILTLSDWGTSSEQALKRASDIKNISADILIGNFEENSYIFTRDNIISRYNKDTIIAIYDEYMSRLKPAELLIVEWCAKNDIVHTPMNCVFCGTQIGAYGGNIIGVVCYDCRDKVKEELKKRSK